MRESLLVTSASSSTRTRSNMAFTTNCMESLDLTAEKKEIKRKTWKMRIQFLFKVKSSASKSKGRKYRAYRPTADDVKQWSQSLDKLLAHKYGKAAFCVFLKSEFCEENIEFWLACEDYRSTASQAELALKANRIYDEFIRSEAPKEINLDFRTKNAITQSLGRPSESSFLSAQRRIYSLMENNCYPRFIYSDLYKELCAAAAPEAKAVPKHHTAAAATTTDSFVYHCDD